MEPAEAVAMAEQWLREAHEPDVALRVDRDRVRRIPEGWAVPYNTVAYLDEGRREKGIFPPPVLIAREPEGDLRHAAPHPGGLSIPVRYPGREYWQEVVDHEYADAGLGYLGVPSQVVAGWRRIAADGTDTGEERMNPEYRTGPIRRGYFPPVNKLDYLLLFLTNRWLDRRRFLIGLSECDVFLPREVGSTQIMEGTWDKLTRELKVWTSTRALPPTAHAWRRVDVVTLVESLQPVPILVITGGPGTYARVDGAELKESLAEFPRFEPKVDVSGDCPEVADELTALARESAARLGLPQAVGLPRAEAADARRRGYELTSEESRKIVLGRSWLRRAQLPQPPPWPSDLAEQGLVRGRAEPRVDTFGKYCEVGMPGLNFGWHRIAGAYVGFALGEALVSDFRGNSPFAEWLIACTVAVIRSDKEIDERLLAELEPPGLPSGPAGLIAALPGVLPLAHRGVIDYEASQPAVRALAARAGAATDTDLTAAAYLGLLFERMFEYEFSYPAAAASYQVLARKEGPAWEEIKALASQSLIGLASTGLPGLKDPKTIGDGTTTLSVLGRALAAVSGFENYPERALRRAVEGSGGSTLVGALAGAMIGARTGIPGLPQKWLTRLESRYALEDLATDAVHRFEADPAHSPLPKEREPWLRRYPPVKNPVSAEKWRGSLLAGAVGDALGAPIEFLSTDAILERYGPNGVTDYVNHSAGAGSITDDTQMTLFTAEALVRAHAQRRRHGAADVRHALQLAYQRWLHTQSVPWERARGPRATTAEPNGWLITNRGLFHRRAPGSTCFASLENYGRTGDIGSFTHQLNDSKGCGGVMRAAPAALWSDDPGEVFELGAVSAALTHSHPSGYLSAGTLAVIVQQLLAGAALDTAIATARAQLVRWPGHEEQAAALDAAVALATQGNPTAAKVESLGSGFVGESALAIAVYAALVTKDPNTALLVAVNHSGDSDSTGAVCGNIVGAYYGERAINPGWLARLELRELIEQLAEDTLAEFGPNPPTGHDWYLRYPSDPPEPHSSDHGSSSQPGSPV